MTYLEKALKNGDAYLLAEGKTEQINYVAIKRTERYTDPEEKVRAEYWAELIDRYGYDPNCIGIEVRVPDRTPNDIADLVIFHDDKQTRPYAVIECKRDDITDSEFDQAVEQACGNGTWAKLRANFVGVVAGQTRRFLDFSPKYGVLEREANIIADLPRQYGKPEEFRFWKGGQDDISPVNKKMLIATIKKCHQTLWGGGKLSPPEAFGELCKIIFVKISDEASCKMNAPYKFQIKTHESSSNLAERLQSIYETEQQKEPDVVTDSIKIDAPTLRIIVSHLEGINLSDTDLDIKGVAFETFMDGFFKGHFGQYFTPREVIDFMVDMMQPQNSERVLDPACGSGGFLLHALNHVRKEAKNYHDNPERRSRHWHNFAEKRLFGIEVNEEIARVAKMNMILHDDGHTNVISADALQHLDRIRERTGNNEFKERSFDLILTNPPFGAKVSLSEQPYLEDYKLGNQTNKAGRKRPRKNQRTEILFLERIWDFLKPGTGRAAVIIPDGILTNSSLQEVRDFLLEHFQIKAIVSLPQMAFAHFGAGVKASIVFLRRRDDSEKLNNDEPIFMAIAERIGYDATGRKDPINDLNMICDEYREFSNENPDFFG